MKQNLPETREPPTFRLFQVSRLRQSGPQSLAESFRSFQDTLLLLFRRECRSGVRDGCQFRWTAQHGRGAHEHQGTHD